jgi:hypothetical protein
VRRSPALLRLTARFSSCIGGIAAPPFVLGGSLRAIRGAMYTDGLGVFTLGPDRRRCSD